MDLLFDGAAWLSQQRRQYMASKVSVCRPSSGARLKCVLATRGRSQFAAEANGSADGLVIQSESDDFIIAAIDYKLDDIPVRPAVGDRITDSAGSTYEVLAFGSEPCWRWCDSFNIDMRIHTKLIELPAQ